MNNKQFEKNVKLSHVINNMLLLFVSVECSNINTNISLEYVQYVMEECTKLTFKLYKLNVVNFKKLVDGRLHLYELFI